MSSLKLGRIDVVGVKERVHENFEGRKCGIQIMNVGKWKVCNRVVAMWLHEVVFEGHRACGQNEIV